MILSLTAAAACADEALTWDECVREALQHNPDLTAAQAAVRKASADYHASYGTFLPEVSANLTVDKGQTDLADGGISRTNQNSVGLSASEPLFTGFKNTGQVLQQRATLQAAEAARALANVTVSADLRTAFAQLLYAQEQVRLNEAIATRRHDNVRLIDLRYHSGRENQGSLLRIQAAAQQADFDVAQAARALRVAQQQLAGVLGRLASDGLAADGQLEPEAVGALPDFAALLARTPAHRQAEANTRAAGAGVTIARSGFFPTVSATGSLSKLGNNDWPPGRDRWLAELVISLPLFEGGRTVFDVQSAVATRAQSHATLKSTDDQLMVSLRQDFAAFQDAVGRVVVQKNFLHAAEVRAEIARSQYAAGLLSFQDWDLIENDLIANQKTTLTTQRDAVIAQATWERTQGASVIP